MRTDMRQDCCLWLAASLALVLVIATGQSCPQLLVLSPSTPSGVAQSSWGDTWPGPWHRTPHILDAYGQEVAQWAM